MSQSRKQSFVESLTNVAIGYSINYIANLIVMPLFGFHVTLEQNLWLGAIYTLISITRSYLIRRWYNNRKAHR